VGRTQIAILERTFTAEGLDSERKIEFVLTPRGEGNTDEYP
jgi:hypothetical protein